MIWDKLYPPMDWELYKSDWPNASHSRFIELVGQRWHVQILGSGPVVLLLHGTGASTHSWRDVAPVLAQKYTVVMPDLPGHGFTTLHAQHEPSLPHMSADVRRLLAKLNIWPSAILGHSAGAAVAAHISLEAKAEFAPAVVGLNPAWLPQPGAAQWLFVPTAKLMALNPYSGRLVANHLAKPWVVSKLLDSTGSHIDQAGQSYYARLVSNPTHVNGVLRMMAAWNLDAIAGRLEQLAAPVLVHAGENDKTVPVDLARASAQCIPGSTLTVKPGLGHLAHEEAPVQTAQEILGWLSQMGR